MCYAVFQVYMDLGNQRRFSICWGSFTGGRGGYISSCIKVMRPVPVLSFLLVTFFILIATKVVLDCSVLRVILM